MKVYRTAGLTAVWRSMGKVENHSTEQVSIPMKIVGYLLGLLDPNSVETIAQRTKFIDTFVRRLKPKYVVEIGVGYSSRSKRFDKIKFYELDLPYFSEKNRNITSFDIGRDELKLDVKEALFIVEGVTMYLQKKQIMDLLNQVKKYKGHLLIDFINLGGSTRKKSIRMNLYKFIFKLIIGRNYLFDFRIKNVQEVISLLRGLGYKKINYCPYKIPRTVDALFYAKL
nr:hypothetical protein [Nanoarchaeota archaeon]